MIYNRIPKTNSTKPNRFTSKMKNITELLKSKKLSSKKKASFKTRFYSLSLVVKDYLTMINSERLFFLFSSLEQESHF